METNKNQIFNKSISEIIKARTSMRSYDNISLTEEHQNSLTQFFSKCSNPFGIDIRFNLVNSASVNKDSDTKLGTYGVIKGTSFFVTAVVQKKENNLEALGFSLEKLILFATSLGLGTCWLAGTFKKSEFAKAAHLKDNELLPVITPIGYPKQRRNLVDSLMRLAAGSNNRKPWSEIFFNETFGAPLTEIKASNYSEPLEMLRLAPSASNKQPWIIVGSKNNFHFFLKHAKGYASALEIDIQKVDIGIAMCHFELTSLELGLKGSWNKLDHNIKDLPEDMEYIISWTSL